jgi:hypothetical protein
MPEKRFDTMQQVQGHEGPLSHKPPVISASPVGDDGASHGRAEARERIFSASTERLDKVGQW